MIHLVITLRLILARLSRIDNGIGSSVYQSGTQILPMMSLKCSQSKVIALQGYHISKVIV